jgi:hypothetical protein
MMTMTKMEMHSQTVLRPADSFGSVLSSRFLAADLRAEIERLLESEGSIVVDFEGVEAVSPSFADELFAKLPRAAIESKQIRFENVGPSLMAIARYVIAGRPPEDTAS